MLHGASDNPPEIEKPYVTQILFTNHLEQSSDSEDEFLFNNVNVSLPLIFFSKSYPLLFNELLTSFSKLSSFTKSVHVVSLDCTYINICVNKLPVRAVLDTGAPGNILSSKFVKRLGIQPDLVHEEVYGTVGPHCTKSTGAYSSLPMKFGAFMICAPAIVLDNQDYDILISTSFLQNRHVEISYNTMTTILKQVLPIFTTRSLKKVRSINVVIDNKPHHMSYILNRKHTHPLPDINKNDRGNHSDLSQTL